jgi:uncharacterized membrane protein YoaK (UPF0700 family)
MKPSLPILLSLNGGYVDTAGYLALQGLFSAHVTGNFVTFGAAIAHGTSGATAKLLALPMFCGVVILVRVASYQLPRRNLPVLQSLLALKLALLVAAAALASLLGPFTDGDSASALITGMTLVAAMAIQNAVHRIYLPKSPPTTLMTGTSTQIMIDIADLMHALPSEARTAAHQRLVKMSASVGAFAAGCAIAALAYVLTDMKAFFVPPAIALFSLVVSQKGRETDAS